MISPSFTFAGVCIAILLLMLAAACGGKSGAGPEPQPAPLTIEDQLAELDALPLPKGVDSLLWTQLKGEMKKILLEQNKVSSAAPAADASQTTLRFEPAAQELHWSFFSQGDYDQNGEVNISDITPIAQNFGKSAGGGSFAVEAIESVIDGDGNGEINIADLTPIGINFGRRVGSYNIYKSASSGDYPPANTAANGAGATLVGTVDLTSAVGDSSLERLSFEFALGQPDASTFYWVRPNDAVGGTGEDGTPSSVLDSAELNQPPVAIWSIAEGGGPPPFDLTIGIGDSYDPDGTIVLYEVDFESDGVFELVFNSNPYVVQHTFTEAGFYDLLLRVTDDDGAQVTATRGLAISPALNQPPDAVIVADPNSGPAPQLVQIDASGSSDPDGAIVRYDFDLDGGFEFEHADAGPTISHNFENGGLHRVYVRVIDDGGASTVDSVEINLTDEGNLAPLASLAADVLSGERPLTVQFDASDSFDTDGTITEYNWDFEGDGEVDRTTTEPFTSFVFVRQTQYLPAVTAVDNDQAESAPDAVAIEVTKGWNTVQIDEFDTVDRTRTVVVSDDGVQRPFVAYTRGYPFDVDLRTVLGFAGGASFPQPLTAASNVGEKFDLLVLDGVPALTLRRENALKIQLATDITGAAWHNSVIVDDTAGVGTHSISAAVVNDNPAVVYSNFGGGTAPLYCRATAPDGTAWGDPLLLALDLNTYLSDLTVSGGVPCAIAVLYGASRVCFFRGSDEDGTTFDAPLTLQPNVQSNAVTIAVIDDKPATCYWDHGALWYLAAADEQGASWNAPVAIANPGPLEVAVDPLLAEINGLPAVAYLQFPVYDVMYVESNNVDGTSWKQPELVDGTEVITGLDLAELNDLPALSYGVRGDSYSLRFTYLPQEGPQ